MSNLWKLKKNEQYLKTLKKHKNIDTFISINIDKLKKEIEFTQYHKKFVEIQRSFFHSEIFNIKS